MFPAKFNRTSRLRVHVSKINYLFSSIVNVKEFKIEFIVSNDKIYFNLESLASNLTLFFVFFKIYKTVTR